MGYKDVQTKFQMDGLLKDPGQSTPVMEESATTQALKDARNQSGEQISGEEQ